MNGEAAAHPTIGSGSGHTPERTRICLVRHGETDWNRLGLYQGTADVPLNAAGRRQARALAGTLASVEFDAAYASPLRRARESAELILARRSVPLVLLPGLREISYGLWQGKGACWRQRCDPGLDRLWRTSPRHARFPGGESLAELRARAVAALEHIIAAHDGKSVLVCSHGHVNRIFLLHALGRPLERFWEIEQPNGCVHVLERTAASRSGPPLYGVHMPW